MNSFPIIIQPDSMDCGAASLKMISKYYGKDVNIDKLRELTYLTKDGVSLFSISEAAMNLGFKTIGGKITFDKLEKDALLPCIVHWKQNHFFVVYKIKKKGFLKRESRVYIADPAFGRVSYTKDEFKNEWISTQSDGQEKGVVLLLEPTHEFYNKKSESTKGRSFKLLFSYFLKYKKFFSQLAIGLLLGSLLQLIFPFLTQAIVDTGIRNNNIGFIYLVLLAQLMLVVSRMSVEFIRRWILLHISTRINISLISDFFIKLMKLPMSYFDSKLTGDILQRIDDHERIQDFLTARSFDVIFSMFTFIIFGTVLWIYNLKIFIIFLIGSLLYTAWVLIFLKKRRVIDYKYFEVRSRNQSKTFQLIQGMQEIKLQNAEQRKRWDWEDVQAELFQINVSALKLEQSQEAGNIFINEVKNIIITIFAALAVINNEMTLGMMLATQYIIGQLSLPIEQTVNFIHDLQHAKISFERINEIHNKEDENSQKQKHPQSNKGGSISVHNLVFQYEGPHSKKVLNNICFIIPKGKVTAIVGASGSGKTTLIKILLQYYKPVAGKIVIDGNDLKEVNTIFWRNQCGAVMQDGFIFSESIALNIAVGDSELDEEKLVQAAKIANIHDFVMELPLKYNTVIGNEGQNLSQGQKQRILIARAIYKNPDFLFFDEATNALDASNEKVIVEKLQDFYKGKTVIIVAHRLSTVKRADQIIVLDNGEIVEVGNHVSLTAKKGAYYQLVKNQLELGN